MANGRYEVLLPNSNLRGRVWWRRQISTNCNPSRLPKNFGHNTLLYRGKEYTTQWLGQLLFMNSRIPWRSGRLCSQYWVPHQTRQTTGSLVTTDLKILGISLDEAQAQAAAFSRREESVSTQRSHYNLHGCCKTTSWLHLTVQFSTRHSVIRGSMINVKAARG